LPSKAQCQLNDCPQKGPAGDADRDFMADKNYLGHLGTLSWVLRVCRLDQSKIKCTPTATPCVPRSRTRGRSRRERQPRPPLLSRQRRARGRERLCSWRVRLPRPSLPSPQQAQAPGVVAWLVALHGDASVAIAQHLSALW
jgi:hypothetical protein